MQILIPTSPPPASDQVLQHEFVETVTDQHCRVARHDCVRWSRLSCHRARTNHRTITDRYSRHHDGRAAYPYVVANHHALHRVAAVSGEFSLDDVTALIEHWRHANPFQRVSAAADDNTVGDGREAADVGAVDVSAAARMSIHPRSVEGRVRFNLRKRVENRIFS